ncbi:AraC family transcriptional regulator [Thalassospira sp. TSL5-1]|uniref:helix-turn-helix domain-containing protein n=1 Tax=Thalassospira sp. TSL5-1 TaxID=1544451 RepID=UPI0009F9D8F2|nr:AraC family transcriptional regulator [Thalassospira sp. TSL5-1]
MLSFRNYRSETLTHSHDDFHQIIISHHGVLDLDVDGAGGEVRGRQIAFVPAGAKHAYRAQGMNRFLVIDLDAQLAENAGLEQLWRKAGGGAYLSVARDIRFGDLENLLAAKSSFGDTGLGSSCQIGAGFPLVSAANVDMALDGYANARSMTGQYNMLPFLTDLLRAAHMGPQVRSVRHDKQQEQEGGIPPRVARAMEWASARLGEPVSIAGMARIAALSESALFAAFERHIGCSPMRWLAALRLDCGRDLLTDHNNTDTIGEIARQAGFQDQAAFSRAFSRRFGLSPAQYRKQCRVCGT